jgi:hypothetical protein
MSSSCEMIFLTRATNDLLGMWFVDDGGISFDCSSKTVSQEQKGIGGHTRQGDGACDLLGRSNWGVVVRHIGVGGWWWSVIVGGVL